MQGFESKRPKNLPHSLLPKSPSAHMSCSLKSSNAGFLGSHIAEYHRVYKGDAKILDYGSYSIPWTKTVPNPYASLLRVLPVLPA